MVTRYKIFLCFFQVGETAKRGTAESGTFNETTNTNVFNVTVTGLNSSDTGIYTCGIIFDQANSEPVKSEQVTELKVLYIEEHPPPAFAGPRLGSATVSCVVSFPDSEELSLDFPTITWQILNPDGTKGPVENRDELNVIINPETVGLKRTLNVSFTVARLEIEHNYTMELKYKEFEKVQVSDATTLIILDAYMDLRLSETVIRGDTKVDCIAKDAVLVKSYRWYKNNRLYTDGTAKLIASYDTIRKVNVISLEWLDIEGNDEGYYHCEVTFQIGLSISSLANTEKPKDTRLTVLRFKEEPPKSIYISPKFPLSIKSTVLLPSHVTAPIITWVQRNTSGTYDFNQTAGERYTQNNVGYYETTYKLPAEPVPQKDSSIWVTVQYIKIKTPGTLVSDMNTNVQLRRMKMTEARYISNIGTSNYYSVEGAWLLISTEVTNNYILERDAFIFRIRTSDKSLLNVTSDNNETHPMHIVDTSIKEDIVSAQLKISKVTYDLENADVFAEVLFTDGDLESKLNVSETDKATIKVVKVTTQPKSYGFQRPNGTTEGIYAIFENPVVSNFLPYEFIWYSSVSSLPNTQLETEVPSDYVTSSSFNTSLNIIVNDTTKDKYYFVILKFNSGLTKYSDITEIRTEPSYIIVNALCSAKLRTKVQVFPLKTNVDIKDEAFEVGDLLMIYGKVNESHPGGKSRFYLGCKEYQPLMKFTADTSTGYIAVDKMSSTCDSSQQGNSLKVPFRVQGISKITLIATEEKFLLWTEKMGLAQRISVQYTISTPKTESTEAVYSTDNLIAKVTIPTL